MSSDETQTDASDSAVIDAAAIKDRYRKAVIESEKHKVGPLFMIVILLVLALTIILLPLVLLVLYRMWQSRRARSKIEVSWDARTAFAQRAEPVAAFPLMVNRALRRPGSEPCPGLFLICFDPMFGQSITQMGDLAARIGEPSNEMNPADRQFCRKLMRDEDHLFFRRRRIPDSITGGHIVYACDILIFPLLLSGHHISSEMPIVPCMAEPGDRGRIQVMPYWVLQNGGPPPLPEEGAALNKAMCVIEGNSAYIR